MKSSAPLSPRSVPRGMTLIELMLVLVIVATLALLAYQSYGRYVRKAEAAACVGKLVNFGTGLRNYVTDKQEWPQEDVLNDSNGKPPDEDTLWDWWYRKLKPYNIGHDDWYCPTDLKQMEREKKEAKPAEEEESKAELQNPSYIPSKFGPGFYAPHEYPNQPWVVERTGHAEGMNKLMPDGRVEREFNFKALRGNGGGGGAPKK